MNKKSRGKLRSARNVWTLLADFLSRFHKGIPKSRFFLTSTSILLLLFFLESPTAQSFLTPGLPSIWEDRIRLGRPYGICFLLCTAFLALGIGIERIAKRELRFTSRIKALKRQVEFHRSELDAMKEGFPIGLFMVSPKNVLRFANAQFLSFTGLSLAEQIRNSWVESIWADERPDIGRRWQEAFESQLAFSELVRFNCKGVSRWVRLKIIPVRSQNEIIGFMGVAIDESTNVENQEIIGRQLARIEDSQMKLDQAVDVVHSLITLKQAKSREKTVTTIIDSSIQFTPRLDVPNRNENKSDDNELQNLTANHSKSSNFGSARATKGDARISSDITNGVTNNLKG